MSGSLRSLLFLVSLSAFVSACQLDGHDDDYGVESQALSCTPTTWQMPVGVDSLRIGASSVTWERCNDTTASGIFELKGTVFNRSRVPLMTYYYIVTGFGTKDRKSRVKIWDATVQQEGGKLYDYTGAVIEDTTTSRIKADHNWLVQDAAWAGPTPGTARENTPISIGCT